ncbi:MAG: acetyl-CoA carboxylase, carboxyltransferase subunit beta [Capsulimonadaceae bacterium]
MSSEGWFRRRSTLSSAVAGRAASSVPDGVATKCAGCGQILFTRDLAKNLKVCPHCGHHHRLTAAERIAFTADDGSFHALGEGLTSVDALGFPDYPAKLKKGQDVTGMPDAMQFGTARIQGSPCILGVTDFFFMGGSMGSVFGEKIVRAMETGIERRLPVILYTSSGGARMQEGLISLMQMAKTSAAAALLATHKVPYLVVLTDPTTGGVLASYASLGDIILAEPAATIGFAGARVAAQGSVQKPPPDYQLSEWQLTRGQVDQVVHRRDLPAVLGSLLRMLGYLPEEQMSTPSPNLPAEDAIPSRYGPGTHEMGGSAQRAETGSGVLGVNAEWEASVG